MNTSRALRCSAIAFGAVLLASAGAAAASADETDHGAQDIDVNVEIQEIKEPGVLALTVAGTGTAELSEDGSTDLERRFTGTLPTVTVTDTRTAEEIPDGAYWYVMGTASDFVDAETTASFSAGHLGWAPALLAGDGEPFVSVGDEVAPVTDEGGRGLVEQELLYLVDSEPGAAAGGSWSATAGLELKVPADVEPGSYSSTLTLSLFE